MKKGISFRQWAPALVAVAALYACDGPDPAGIADGQEPRRASELADVAQSTPLACPSDSGREVTRLLGLAGGTVGLEKHRIEVPPGVLSVLTTKFTIRVPSSPYMLVDLRANDRDHYEFRRPVRVTIDYSRCPLTELEQGPLTVWHVDLRTGELLEAMGGTDDRASRTISFETDHFSGYVIAN